MEPAIWKAPKLAALSLTLTTFADGRLSKVVRATSSTGKAEFLSRAFRCGRAREGGMTNRSESGNVSGCDWFCLCILGGKVHLYRSCFLLLEGKGMRILLQAMIGQMVVGAREVAGAYSLHPKRRREPMSTSKTPSTKRPSAKSSCTRCVINSTINSPPQ